MNVLGIILFGFGIHFIYCNTYPPKIYDALKFIAQNQTLDKNYFENCAYLGAVLAGDISVFNVSVASADETLVQIVSELNETLLMKSNGKIEKTKEGETLLLMNIFDDMMEDYLLLAETPSKTNQNRMRKTCSFKSNELHSIIQKFNTTMDMIPGSYLARYNFTDSSFQELQGIFENVAFQVALTYSICESFMGSSIESIIKNLESMRGMFNDKIYGINEDRREKFWNFEYLSFVVEKLTDETIKGDDQALAVRTNERHHCDEFDTLEENVKKVCVDGYGTKIENIKNYLTAKCSNATVLVLDDSINNYILATNKLKPNIKIANMSSYFWTFIFNIYEQCLKKVFIVIM